MKEVIKKEEAVFEAEDSHVLDDESPNQELPELPSISYRKRKAKVVKRKLKKGKKRKIGRVKKAGKGGRTRKVFRRKTKRTGKATAKKTETFRREKEPKLQIRQNDLVMVQDEEPKPKPRPPPKKKSLPSPDLLDGILEKQSEFLKSNKSLPKKEPTDRKPRLERPSTSTSPSTQSNQPGTSGSYNLQGTSRRYEGQGSSRSYEGQGSSTRYNEQGYSGNYNGQGTSGSYNVQGSSNSYNGQGSSSGYNGYQDPNQNPYNQPGTSASYNRQGPSQSNQPGPSGDYYQGPSMAQRNMPIRENGRHPEQNAYWNQAPNGPRHWVPPRDQAPAGYWPHYRPPALMDLQQPYLGYPQGYNPHAVPHQPAMPQQPVDRAQMEEYNRQLYEYYRASGYDMSGIIPPAPPRDNPNDPPPARLSPARAPPSPSSPLSPRSPGRPRIGPHTPEGTPPESSRSPSPVVGPRTPPGPGPPTPPPRRRPQQQEPVEYHTPCCSPIPEQNRVIAAAIRHSGTLSLDDRENIKWSLRLGPGENNRTWGTFEYALYCEWLIERNLTRYRLPIQQHNHIITMVVNAARKYHWNDRLIRNHLFFGFRFYHDGPGRHGFQYFIDINAPPNPPDLYVTEENLISSKPPSPKPVEAKVKEEVKEEIEEEEEVKKKPKRRVKEEVEDDDDSLEVDGNQLQHLLRNVKKEIEDEERNGGKAKKTSSHDKKSKSSKDKEKRSKDIKKEAKLGAESGGLKISPNTQNTTSSSGTSTTTSPIEPEVVQLEKSSESSDSDGSKSKKIPKRYKVEPASRSPPRHRDARRASPPRGTPFRRGRGRRSPGNGPHYQPVEPQFSHFPSFKESGLPYTKRELYIQRQEEIAMHRQRMEEKRMEDAGNSFDHGRPSQRGRFFGRGRGRGRGGFFHGRQASRSRSPPGQFNRSRSRHVTPPPVGSRSPGKYIAPAVRSNSRPRNARSQSPSRILRFQDHRDSPVQNRRLKDRIQWNINARPDRIRQADGR